jgi:phasin family protein
MTSLPERLSVVRPQWEAQLDAFHALSTRAIDSAEQLFALNIKTSRASVEQATGTWRQMLHATDPRDLFAIGTQAQGQWQQVFSYSRELMGIAMGARQRSWSTIPMPMPFQPAPLLPAPSAHVVEQAGIAIAVATTVTTEMATAAAESNAALAEDTMGVGDQSPATDAGDTDAALPPAGQIEPAAAPAGTPTELDAEKTGEAPSEVAAGDPAESAAPPAAQASALDEETSANVDALVDIVIADAVPPAEPKLLVEALNEVLPKPAGAEHPIASTVPLEAAGHIELPPVAPLDSTPPVQLSNGPAPERRRSSRKKS